MYFRNLTQILNFENNGGGYSKEMPIAVQNRLVGVKEPPWFQDENSSYLGGFLELGVHIWYLESLLNMFLGKITFLMKKYFFYENHHHFGRKSTIFRAKNDHQIGWIFDPKSSLRVEQIFFHKNF